MKRICFIFLLFLLPSLLALDASAYSGDEAQSIADTAGADEIENEYLTEDELSGDKTVNIFQKALSIITDALADRKNRLLYSFGAVIAIILLASVMQALKLSENGVLDPICQYISVLALSGVTYSLMYKLFIYVIASMEALNLAMSSLMPIMSSLHIMGGTAGAGAASGAGLTLFLSVLSTICTKVLLPLLRISFALCLVGAVPQSVNLSSVCNLVKNTATTVMAFIFSLLGFTLYLQTGIASAGDTYITRSIKFASGVFVPVIGGMLGDASRTVIASVSVVKGTVGAAGTVMVLSAVLPPIISVALHKLLLLACAITAKTLGCERESAFLYDLCGITSVLLALTAGAGAVCIIAVAVFIKTGVTV